MENEFKSISFNENKSFSISFDRKIVDEGRHFFFLFSIENAFSHAVYCIIDANIDNDGFLCDYSIPTILIEISKFKELKSLYEYDFLRDIVVVFTDRLQRQVCKPDVLV